MWFATEANWILALFALIVVVGFYAQRSDSRIRLIKMQMDRRSIEFLKLETELGAILDSILILSRAQGGDIEKTVLGIRDRRTQLLRFVIENGPNSAELLRGLEFPDFRDDKAFWADDRWKRLGLQTDDEKKATP